MRHQSQCLSMFICHIASLGHSHITHIWKGLLWGSFLIVTGTLSSFLGSIFFPDCLSSAWMYVQKFAGKGNRSKSVFVVYIIEHTRRHRHFNLNFKRLYSTQIYKGKAKTCILHSNVWRLLSRYMHTACISATKKIIDWMTFILHTIAYDQRNQTSYTYAQKLSQWRTVWIMGHEWFDVKRNIKALEKATVCSTKYTRHIVDCTK